MANKIALVIGVARYANFNNLEKTVKDAGAIAEILEQEGNYAIEPLPRKLDATNESRYEFEADPKKEVKYKDLLARIKSFLGEQAKGKDALIYFAGHGFVAKNDADDEIGFFAVTDSSKDGQNGLSFDIFTKLVAKSELNSLVVLLDCCHAGNLLERSQYQGMQKIFNEKNYYLMAACRGSERAREGKEHGIFTAGILNVLQAKIKDGERVDLDLLFSEVSKQLQQSGQEVIRTAGGGAIALIDKARGNVAPVVFENICPYVGLEAFDLQTAKFFKGRDRFVRLLLQKITESSFVPVIGASGSGKSSLVRAGLISELTAQGNWLILPPIKPGDSPLMPVNEISRVLTQLCQRADSKREVSKQIASGNLEAAIACLSEQKKILLVVDQFEEIFTVCPAEKEAERQQFIDLLVGITQYPSSRLWVVTTMRADFFENCLGYRGLGEVIHQHQVLLLPMYEEELQEAITAPALAGQYELGEGLLTAILRDVRGEKNVLPLLEFALTQLWERRDKRRFSFAVYDALGGVMGALNNHAKHIYDALQPQEQEWAKRICLMLVRTGMGERDTRQRQTKSALEQLAKDEALKDFQGALEQLVAGRLLVTGKDENGAAWVDLAHEALMEKWEYFAQWILDNRAILRLASRIQIAFEEWKDNQESELFLLPRGVVIQWEKAVPAINDYLTFEQQKFVKLEQQLLKLVNHILDAFEEYQRELDKDKFLLPEGVVAQIEEVEVAINDYLTLEQQGYVQRSHYQYKPWLDPANLPEMVEIEGGTFWMGSPEGKGRDNEKPYHQVTVKGFRMGKYPVTQAQWRTVAMSPKVEIDLSLNPSYFRGDNHPVEQVSWLDAQEFCARLSNLTGESYRLPSEAEWEYACRAGADGYTEYCFGNDPSQLDDYGWYDNNSDGNTHPVGQKLPNTWGIYDLHGNVWEWCADDWHDSYAGAPTDPQTWTKDIKIYEVGIGTGKVLRGGSWFNDAYNCRSANRYGDNADGRYINVGFRVVL
jgi:formylglycine-generating enzyme required for sulfatase activity